MNPNLTDKGRSHVIPTRAKQNPSDPFRPKLNSPKLSGAKVRGQANQIATSSDFGKQMTPVSSGKFEYRMPNKRQGFTGISKRMREDGNGVGNSKRSTKVTPLLS